jgi:LysR family glycine cleavage system transcriptional activator
MPDRRLPNLNALKAFEAAARHLSFTKAAAELNVTQGAVSHQVQALEEQLGLLLFKRMNRRLALTEAGRNYLPALGEAFDRIAEATRRLGRDRSAGPLKLSTMPSFASRWLLPRLAKLRRVAPELELMISATPALVDLHDDQFDLVIRFGVGSYPDLTETFLMGDAVVPVCAPALLQRAPLRKPEDLAHHTLLHDEVGPREQGVDWQRWLSSAGVKGIDVKRGPIFSDSSFVVLAAIAGEGVGLARLSLCQDDLVAGRLVQPFGPIMPVAMTYRLLTTPEKAAWPKVERFRDWILAEIAALPALPPAADAAGQSQRKGAGSRRSAA